MCFSRNTHIIRYILGAIFGISLQYFRMSRHCGGVIQEEGAWNQKNELNREGLTRWIALWTTCTCHDFNKSVGSTVFIYVLRYLLIYLDQVFTILVLSSCISILLVTSSSTFIVNTTYYTLTKHICCISSVCCVSSVSRWWNSTPFVNNETHQCLLNYSRSEIETVKVLTHVHTIRPNVWL